MITIGEALVWRALSQRGFPMSLDPHRSTPRRHLVPVRRAEVSRRLPVAGRITSAMGLRQLSGEARRLHAGIDIAAPEGTPVHATMAGKVVDAGWHHGYGWLVILDHGDGEQTYYAHLSVISVVVGRYVNEGDVVGLVGHTGHARGAHLHYEVRIDHKPINPMG